MLSLRVSLIDFLHQEEQLFISVITNSKEITKKESESLKERKKAREAVPTSMEH